MSVRVVAGPPPPPPPRQIRCGGCRSLLEYDADDVREQRAIDAHYGELRREIVPCPVCGTITAVTPWPL